MKMKLLNRVVSLPRALSKLGYCSRSKAMELINNGLVKVNSKIYLDVKRRVNLDEDIIQVKNERLELKEKICIMLNKPKGLITTARDEKNRDTVFKCFEGYNIGYIFPVGRLDKASEGLLLFTNDSKWAEKILNPESHVEKVYHVQLNIIPDGNIIQKLIDGVEVNNELLKVKHVKVIRSGHKNSWIEITLEEGKNRQIRKMLSALDVKVLRLIRIAIGRLKLGDLKKGEFRSLSKTEAESVLN